MNTTNYAKEIKQALNIKHYCNLVKALGSQLNSRKDRFDKSDIIEQCIEVYSGGRFKYVDLEGRDHIDTERDFDLEFKYISNGLFTKSKKQKSVVKAKLKNSLGQNKGVTIEDPADYYIFGQEDAMAIISWEDLKHFLVAVPDGIEAHVPFENLDFVFVPGEVIINNSIEIDYKTEKRKAQLRIIESAKV